MLCVAIRLGSSFTGRGLLFLLDVASAVSLMAVMRGLLGSGLKEVECCWDTKTKRCDEPSRIASLVLCPEPVRLGPQREDNYHGRSEDLGASCD